MTEYDRAENAQKGKVEIAIARLERFLDRADGLGRTVGRIVGFVTAASSWARRIF
jgi:hypothetical protein